MVKTVRTPIQKLDMDGRKDISFYFGTKNLIGNPSDFDMLGTKLVYKWAGFSLEKTWCIV